MRKFNIMSVLTVLLITTATLSFGSESELNSLIQQYQNALKLHRTSVTPESLDRLKAITHKINKLMVFGEDPVTGKVFLDRDVVNHLKKKMNKSTFEDFAGRSNREFLNAKHRAQAMRGEIKPFSKNEGPDFNKSQRAKPLHRRTIETELDPKEMERIFPENRYVKKDPARKAEQEDIAKVVKKARDVEAPYKEKTTIKRPPETDPPDVPHNSPKASKKKVSAEPQKRPASQKSKDQSGGRALPKSTAQDEYKLKGKSSFGSTKGVREVTGEIVGGVMVGGALGESMVQKMGEAADEDRDFTARDAVETLDEGLGIKAAREDVYRIANKHGKEEALKWQKGEQDLQQSLVKAGAKTIAEGAAELGEQTVVKPMEEVVENRLDEMEAKAKAEGRKPDMVDGAKFFFGSLGEGATNIVVGPAARAYGEATTLDERRDWARQKAELGKFVDRNLKHGLWKIDKLQAELDNLIHQGDPNDSTNQKRTQELLNEYESEYLRMEKLRGLAERNLGDEDAKRVNRMREELSYLTDPDTMREYADDVSQQHRDTFTGNHSSSAIDAGGINESVGSGEKAVEATSEDGEASEGFVQEGEEHQVVSGTKNDREGHTVGQEEDGQRKSFGHFSTGTSDDTLYCPEDPDELEAKCNDVNGFIGKHGKGEWTASLQRAYLFKAQCCGYRWTTEGPENDAGKTTTTHEADVELRQTRKPDLGLMGVTVDEKDQDMPPFPSDDDDESWFDAYKDDLHEHRAKKYRSGEADRVLQDMRRRQQQVANDPEWDMLMQQSQRNLGTAAKGLSNSLRPGSSGPNTPPPSRGWDRQQRLPYMENDPYINRGYRKYQEDADKKQKQPSSKGTGSTTIPDTDKLRLLDVEPGDTTVPGEDNINNYWPSR